MRIAALAADFDGTLAREGRVEPRTVAALERLAASGRKLVLVTGRELDELLALFPDIRRFDRVVAENGALLFDPATGSRRVLGERPPDAFVAALQRRGVPISVGATIVATVEPHETTVLEVIRDLGLELHVIFNKGAVMVLPASVNKASGLQAALAELKLSARNVAAIGDGENDHALLRFAEVGVAVANAIPMLRREADVASELDHGAAVVELIERILDDDLRGVLTRSGRRQVVIGSDHAGSEVRVPAVGTRILVAGAAGTGKRDVAAGLLERACAGGYQFFAIDPSGDYDDVANAIVLPLTAADQATDEAMTALDRPDANIVAQLSVLAPSERVPLARDLLRRLSAHRAATGRPHWILVAEAHHVLAGDGELPVGGADGSGPALVLVATHPERIAAPVLGAVDAVLALGAQADAALAAFARAAGRESPPLGPPEERRAPALLWSAHSPQDAPAAVNVLPGAAARRRDRRARLHRELPVERSFYFRGPDGRLKLRAQNLAVFMQTADGVDDATWLHHLQRGEYSAWIRSGLLDATLAEQVGAVERGGGDAGSTRAAVRAAIESRYGELGGARAGAAA